MQGLLWRIGTISEAIWCTWKSVLRLQVRTFKNCNNWTPEYKDLWRWKSLYFEWWIKAYTPVEKKSSQNWNTLIHLKSNDPHIQVLWFFGFLSWLSTYVFNTKCGLNWYAYILEIVLVMLNKHIYDSHNVCGCSTLNEMLIKLVSLIIYSINANLTNISSTPPSEVKKAVLYSTFNNFLYLNRNLYLLGI